jgi:hypothetical protein
MDTLKEYYDSLPIINRKRLFIDKIVKETGRNIVTVYRWINGECKPQSKLERRLLSKFTGIAQKRLFPKDQDQ